MPNPFARIVRGLVHAFRGQRAAQVAAETASSHNASVGQLRPAPGVPVPGQPSQMWPATAQGFAPLNYAPADYDGLPAENYPKPYTDVSELDPTGYETDTMREAYIELHRSNPEVRSAIEGKVAAVARLDLSLLPADEDNPRDREVAEWCQWCIDAGGGSDAIISEMLTPALINGWSVGEVKRNTNPRHLPVKFRDRPRWSLEYVRQLDTRLIKPQLDVYRNIKALVSFVRGAERALPERYLIFTHHRFLHNPFGQSDLRAAFRSARMIDDAYKLWFVLIRNYGGPVILGKAGVGTQSSRAFLDRFDKALKECRQSGWIRCAAEDEVEVINLASAVSFEAFQSKIKAHREAILLAVRGAYLPFVEGSGNNPRGDTAVNKMASNDVEELLARAVARALTNQLLPLLVVPNYGRDCPMPRVQLGGKIQAEIDAALGNADKLQKMGLPVGKKWLYKTANVPPPMDPGDAVSPPGQGGPGGPGMPGLGGGPQPGGPGGPGGDADPANDPLLQLFGGGDSGGGGDQAGGQQVPQLGGGAAAPNQHIPPRPGLVWNAPASRYRAVDNFSSPPQPQADGCVLVPLPDDAAAAVRRAQAGLDPADVLEHEDQPHLTLRYGLLPVSPPAVANCLAGEGLAFDVGPRLGLFRQPEADVLYLAAEGDDPARLNRLLGYLPNRTAKEYVPHVTVAYLRPGAGDRYLSRPAAGEAISVFADWCSYHPAGGGQAVRVPLAAGRDTFAAHPGDSIWQPYVGKAGGKGWVNQYGTVVYQANKPASRGGKPQVSGNAGSPGHQPGAGGQSPPATAGAPAGSGSSQAQGGAAQHNPHELIKKLGAGQALSDDEAKALPGLVMGMGVFELRAVRGHLGVASTGLKHEVANRIVAAAQAKQAQLGGSPIPGQGAAGGASPPAPPAQPAQPASPPPPAAPPPPPPAASQAANAGTSPATPVSAASSAFGPVVASAAMRMGIHPSVLPTMQDAVLVHTELMKRGAINAGVSPADVQIEMINQHVAHGRTGGQPGGPQSAAQAARQPGLVAHPLPIPAQPLTSSPADAADLQKHAAAAAQALGITPGGHSLQDAIDVTNHLAKHGVIGGYTPTGAVDQALAAAGQPVPAPAQPASPPAPRGPLSNSPADQAGLDTAVANAAKVAHGASGPNAADNIHTYLWASGAIDHTVTPADISASLARQQGGQTPAGPPAPASPPTPPPTAGGVPSGKALLQKIASGQALDAGEHAALPGLVMAMSVPDLRAARQALGVQASGLRSAYAAKILAAAQARNQQLGGAAALPAPPVQPPVARGQRGVAVPASPPAPVPSAAPAAPVPAAGPTKTAAQIASLAPTVLSAMQHLHSTGAITMGNMRFYSQADALAVANHLQAAGQLPAGTTVDDVQRAMNWGGGAAASSPAPTSPPTPSAAPSRTRPAKSPTGPFVPGVQPGKRLPAGQGGAARMAHVHASLGALQALNIAPSASPSSADVAAVQSHIQQAHNTYLSRADVDRAIKNAYGMTATTHLPPIFNYGGSRGPSPGIQDDGSRPRLSHDERLAAQVYTTQAYHDLNQALRQTGAAPQDANGVRYQKLHADLQSAFGKATTFAQPVQATRMLNLKAADAAKLVADLRRAQQTGGHYVAGGYTSVSPGGVQNLPPLFQSGNVQMNIKAVHGLDMKPHTHHPHATELLLNHGSAFKVTGVTQQGGRWVVDMEQVPPGQGPAYSPAAAAKPARAPRKPKAVPAAAAGMPTAAPGAYPAGLPAHQRLIQSTAFKTLLATPTHARPSLHSGIAGGHEDKFMTQLMADVGRAAPPAQVLDRAGIDALEQQGWVIGYRGVRASGGKTAQQIHDEARYGGHYSGAGIYGNGVYMAAAHSSRTSPGAGKVGSINVTRHSSAHGTATSYGSGGAITRYAIPPTANVVTDSTLKAQRSKDLAALARDHSAGRITQDEYDTARKVMSDLGRYAILKNYDGITVKNGFFVMLNRSIVAMQRSNL